MQLMLEVDGGTERAGALRARVRAWTSALHIPRNVRLLDPARVIVLWVTTGTWRRVETLRQAWASATTEPAFFTTLYALRGYLETAPLDLLHASWRDRDGRSVAGHQIIGRPAALR